jgi:RNA polymerase sigma-70 factor (ECF subfamily)
MNRYSDSQTRVTLLERLARSGARDQAAWDEFVDHYGRKIYRWCKRWGLQEADAQDVTQIVLLKLFQSMRDFTYDPQRSFRAWLKTVAHNAWKDYVEGRRRAAVASGNEAERARLESIEARDDLASELEAQFERERLQTAMRIVRLRASAHNWEAFVLTAVKGIPAAEVALKLEMKVARVYAARSAIQQRIKEECDRLEMVPTSGS